MLQIWEYHEKDRKCDIFNQIHIIKFEDNIKFYTNTVLILIFLSKFGRVILLLRFHNIILRKNITITKFFITKFTKVLHFILCACPITLIPFNY